jgi:hypothetical protein
MKGEHHMKWHEADICTPNHVTAKAQEHTAETWEISTQSLQRITSERNKICTPLSFCAPPNFVSVSSESITPYQCTTYMLSLCDAYDTGHHLLSIQTMLFP